MLIKALTKYSQSPNSVEHATIYDNVEKVDISDVFDLETIPLSEYDIVVAPDYPVKEGSQAQHIRYSFWQNGIWKTLYSAMPVYLMNDSGKTIQSYHPVNARMN